MLLALALASEGRAYDLQVHVGLPGVGPVVVQIEDIEPGTVEEVTWPGDDDWVYELGLTVAEGEEYDWEIAFELTGVRERRNGRHVESKVFRPTMLADTGQLAQFWSGGNAAIPGGDPRVSKLYAVTLLWIVQPDKDAADGSE